MQLLYDWPQVRKVLHDTVIKSIKTDPDTLWCIRDLSSGTDQFHPFDNDGDLQHYLGKLESEDMHRAFDAIDAVAEMIERCLDEISDNIKEYFGNAWNHAPGYKEPVIEYGETPCGEKLLPLLLSDYGKSVIADTKKRMKAEHDRQEKEKRVIVRDILKKRNVTAVALKEAYAKHEKIQLWLAKNIAACNKKNKKPVIRQLSEHVVRSLLTSLRFPRYHRWRATDMTWRLVSPIVRAEIEKENT